MFLYNSHGKAIAYRRTTTDKWLWDASGRWIGWFPWDDDYACSKIGSYLGTIVGNRLYRKVTPQFRGYPGYPGYPGYAGYPGYGGYGGFRPPPPGYRDLNVDKLSQARR